MVLGIILYESFDLVYGVLSVLCKTTSNIYIWYFECSKKTSSEPLTGEYQTLLSEVKLLQHRIDILELEKNNTENK